MRPFSARPGRLATRPSPGFGGGRSAADDQRLAAAVPGTVGGAVYGNAGAFGGDMAHNLIHAEVLTEKGLERWPVEKMEYGYRTSVLKRSRIKCIILTAEMRLTQSTREAVKAKIAEFVTRRKATQPLGASMGSMFKNPPGDYAGRLIEAAGLKGTRIGNAEVSTCARELLYQSRQHLRGGHLRPDRPCPADGCREVRHEIGTGDRDDRRLGRIGVPDML